nr:DUF975 family protein [Paucilactobacillus hokkaidonensis]
MGIVVSSVTVTASILTGKSGIPFSIFLIFTLIELATGLILAGLNLALLDYYRGDSGFLKAFTSFKYTKNYFVPIVKVWFVTCILLWLWSLLLFIPGLIKGYSYSQTLYIYFDHLKKGQQVKVINCITESRKLMDGHKMNLFILQLSFIGWMLLAGLTRGIGYLWLEPYMAIAVIAFYTILIKDNEPERPANVENPHSEGPDHIAVAEN